MNKTGQLILRWAKFSAVGATGIAVQTVALFFLLHVPGLHYLAATALAVEASVLHNFIWHRKWTWADRPRPGVVQMLVRFNLTNGVLCLTANLALMFVFVDKAGLPAYMANLGAIAICSLLNFFLSDRFVFVSPEA
ncbi:MAG TPA: GtrA family protein [Blastocatellia bacterium]|nr:GtrA family protein [Blastocatellia bacterium]